MSFTFVSPQPTPTTKFLQGYVGAVTSAVSIAVSVCCVQGQQNILSKTECAIIFL